jgi:drug/metabolite transporter (DMT)-like permease
VITFVNPAVAVALGVIALGEPLSLGIAVGFPMILAGSVLATGRSPKLPVVAEAGPMPGRRSS